VAVWAAAVFAVAQETELLLEVREGDGAGRTARKTVEQEAHLRAFIGSIQEDHLASGQLKASVNCVILERESPGDGVVKAVWKVAGLFPVFIDSVVVPGHQLARRTTSGIFAPVKNQVASEKSLLRVYDILKQYRFLSPAGRLYYARYGDENVALVVPLDAGARNSFSGIAGYQPRQNGRPRIAGEIKVSLENTFGTASIARIWWQRKDDVSQILSLDFEEPYVGIFHLGAKASFYQNLQDGLYVLRTSRISVVKPYSRTGKWYLGGENSSVNVTPEGAGLGMVDHSIRSLVIENEWDRRDSFWNPWKGFYVWWSGSVGKVTASAPGPAILTRVRSKFELLKSFTGQWTAVLGGDGGFVHLFGDQKVAPSEQFRYGGASSLRGYREQQFSSSWMVMAKLELRYRLDRVGRLHLVLDGALHEDSPRMPLAAGLGIQQKTPLGVLRVEYALSRQDSPSQGKLHIQLLGQF
ncbi:MAG: BamA/TamA family outer membrane protein, partial [Fidelibacterota bacterium]